MPYSEFKLSNIFHNLSRGRTVNHVPPPAGDFTILSLPSFKADPKAPRRAQARPSSRST